MIFKAVVPYKDVNYSFMKGVANDIQSEIKHLDMRYRPKVYEVCKRLKIDPIGNSFRYVLAGDIEFRRLNGEFVEINIPGVKWE